MAEYASTFSFTQQLAMVARKNEQRVISVAVIHKIKEPLSGTLRATFVQCSKLVPIVRVIREERWRVLPLDIRVVIRSVGTAIMDDD